MTEERKRQALGKGLGALIPGGEKAAGQGEMIMVPVEEVFPNPEQPRRAFEAESLEELAASIKEKGVLQPILAQRVPGGYELVAGERRLRASKMAGLDRVPVLVKRLQSDEKLEVALVENLQREDLNPIEEAQAYRDLQEAYSYTQEEVARRVGKDRATVANAIRLLALPEPVREELVAGTITAGHARAMLPLKGHHSMNAVLNRIVDRRLSVREAELAVKRVLSGQRKRPVSASLEAKDLERKLERKLGNKVRIRERKRGGRIEITYGSVEELNGIADRILKS